MASSASRLSRSRKIVATAAIRRPERKAAVTLLSAKTLAGPAIAIRVAGKNVFLNRSTKVVKTDIGATNGTIHVINKVLLPPA